jgi:hypothetical protein
MRQGVAVKEGLGLEGKQRTATKAGVLQVKVPATEGDEGMPT